MWMPIPAAITSRSPFPPAALRVSPLRNIRLLPVFENVFTKKQSAVRSAFFVLPRHLQFASVRAWAGDNAPKNIPNRRKIANVYNIAEFDISFRNIYVIIFAHRMEWTRRRTGSRTFPLLQRSVLRTGSPPCWGSCAHFLFRNRFSGFLLYGAAVCTFAGVI